MKGFTFIIVRLIGGSSWRRGAQYQVLTWSANTLTAAKGLATRASKMFGGNWTFASETARTFTVWV